MATIKQKELACEAYKGLLSTVWLLGRGIMFKNHIERYMRHFFGLHRSVVHEALDQLQKTDLVESITFYNVKIFKLRKYAVCFLVGKKRTEIPAVSVNFAKIKKAAFINAALLSHIEGKNNFSYEKTIKYYLNDSSFFCSEKSSYSVLQRLYEKGFMGERVLIEVNRLKDIQLQNNKFLDGSKQDDIKEVKEMVIQAFAMNHMHSRNVFIDRGQKMNSGQNDIRLHVAILDISGNLSAENAVNERIIPCFDYLNEFLNMNVKLHFTIYTASEQRKIRFDCSSEVINRSLRDYKIFGSLTWDTVNLDLERRLFGGQKILLGTLR